MNSVQSPLLPPVFFIWFGMTSLLSICEQWGIQRICSLGTVWRFHSVSRESEILLNLQPVNSGRSLFYLLPVNSVECSFSLQPVDGIESPL